MIVRLPSFFARSLPAFMAPSILISTRMRSMSGLVDQEDLSLSVWMLCFISVYPVAEKRFATNNRIWRGRKVRICGVMRQFAHVWVNSGVATRAQREAGSSLKWPISFSTMSVPGRTAAHTNFLHAFGVLGH